MLKLLRTFHGPACLALSNTFLKSQIVEQIPLVLLVLLYDDSTIEDLFCCTLAWSKACLFLSQQFLSLGLESARGNSEYDLAGMAK